MAYSWRQPPQISFKWYSYIYRFNFDGFASLEDGTEAAGKGFEVYQLVKTNSASDVTFITIPKRLQPAGATGDRTVLAFASFHSPVAADLVSSYRFDSSITLLHFLSSAWNPLLRAPVRAPPPILLLLSLTNTAPSKLIIKLIINHS